MAHYAFLDLQSRVVRVIVGKDEGQTDWESYYGERHAMPCKRTSYNTRGGVHRSGGQPFRKNYAGVGYTYDAARDAFIPPKPFQSWTLDEASCLWVPPAPRPSSGYWKWDEPSLTWVSP
jgi:hypothetical protein